jgi:hypothetical protein
MKWFRANIRQGSRLALFALAIQFVLSFGHVHAHAAAGLTPQMTGAAAKHASPDGWRALTSWVAGAKAPAGHHSDDGLADDCPVCDVLALANAPLSATPPLPPAPQAAEFAYLISNATPVDHNRADAAFQPRAPPVA